MHKRIALKEVLKFTLKQCNHHHQEAHYLSLLKLQLLKQSIKIHQCGVAVATPQ